MRSAVVMFTFPRDYALAARGVREARKNWCRTGWAEPRFVWVVNERDADSAKAFIDAAFDGETAPNVLTCGIVHGENLNAGAATTEAMLGVFEQVLRDYEDLGGVFKVDSDILWHRPEAYVRNIEDFGVDYIGIHRPSASFDGVERPTCSGACTWISRAGIDFLRNEVPRDVFRAVSDTFLAEDMVWSWFLLQRGNSTSIASQPNIAWRGDAPRNIKTIFTHDNPYRR